MSPWFLLRWMGSALVGFVAGRLSAQMPFTFAVSVGTMVAVVYNIGLTVIRVRYRWYGSRNHVG